MTDPDLLAAIEAIGEHSAVKMASVVIRVRSDRDVDALYEDLGEPVDREGVERPFVDFTSDGTGWERKAATRIAGVSVMIVGPMQVGRRVA